MILTISQIESILKEIDKNVLVYIGTSLGEEVLSIVDKNLLRSMGVELGGIVTEFPPYYQMYLLGRLTTLIGDTNSSKLEYSDFIQYLKKNQYQPLTQFERIQYELARQTTYSHLKNLNDKVKSGVQSSIVETINRTEYEKIIKKEIEEGVLQRKAITDIVSGIGRKTGDWRKDIGRIVDTEMNNIFQNGRAVQIFRMSPKNDPLVYKDVYPGACRHCISLYLTGGIGSKPIIFKLSILINDGTNVGRKVKDWRAVIGGTHPFCRCNLREFSEYMEWDDDKNEFVYDEEKLKEEEKKLGKTGEIKIKIGEKEIVV